MYSHRIIQIFERAEIKKAQQLALSEMEFVDGGLTATGLAKEFKKNLEAADGPRFSELITFVSEALTESEEFLEATFFRAFAKIILSKYDTGMSYGLHVDAPTMEAKSVDFSFTLFLSEPDEYEGGELVIYSDHQETVIKPAAGELVLYPTNFLHEVLPISHGTRTCVVGWVSSFVGCPIARQSLESLLKAAKMVLTKHEDESLHLQLLQAYANIYRSISR